MENRSWRIPPRDVGRWVALHGGATPKGRAHREAMADLRRIVNLKLLPADNLGPFVAPYLGVFAVCRFGEPVRESDSPWFTGPWGWPIVDLIRLPGPVPCKGHLGLWCLPPDVLARVRAGYLEAKEGVA